MTSIRYVITIPYIVIGLGAHIGVGFGVAYLDYLSNARAFRCGMSDRTNSHALFVYVTTKKTFFLLGSTENNT